MHTDVAPLKVGDRFGTVELFEIVRRGGALLYRFRGPGVTFGIEWPYLNQPPTRADLGSIFYSTAT